MAKKYELVYKTSTSPFFPMCLVAQNYGNRTLKELFGLDLSLPVSVLCVINNGTVNWFLEKKCRNISRQLFDEFFSDSKYLKNIKKKEIKNGFIRSKQLKLKMETCDTSDSLNPKRKQEDSLELLPHQARPRAKLILF